MVLCKKNNSFAFLSTFSLNQLLSSSYDLTACLSNCSNNGVCNYYQSEDKYACECFPDYMGDKCQTDSRPCSYYPCLNNCSCQEFLNINPSILAKQIQDHVLTTLV